MMPRIPSDCPDCTAELVDKQLRHEDSCPLGRGCDEFREDDREWFEAHPFAARRFRPIHWAEVASLHHVGAIPPGGEVTAKVEVIKLGERVRARRFHNLLWIPEVAA
jgi:hypothetical protein